MDIVETATRLHLHQDPSLLARVTFFLLVPGCVLVVLYVLGLWLVKRFEPFLLLFLLFPVNLGIIGGILLYAFNDGFDVTLDREADTFQLEERNLLGHTTNKWSRPLSEVVDAKIRVSTTTESDSVSTTISTVCQDARLVRRGGGEIPLLKHTTSLGCDGQQRLADTLHRFLRPREQPVVLDKP
jgi:hypothetical protein